MLQYFKLKQKKLFKNKYLLITVICFFIAVFFILKSFIYTQYFHIENVYKYQPVNDPPVIEIPTLDIEKYNQKVLSLVNEHFTETEDGLEEISIWPPENPLPLAGAILPFKRVIAYYGNLYSTRMGALGEYPEDQMLKMLDDESKRWQVADPETPVQTALHYIASTAQSEPGKEGLYTLRMPDSEIDKIISMAKKSDSIVFLDLQIGLSNLEKEIPFLDKYLKMPQVHLGLDPEFSMKGGQKPGSVIGTMDADDINFAANYLAKIVREHNLPPKILIIHRFTQDMVTNYQDIEPLPEVQIVMHMDGWGFAAKKVNTYKQVIYPEPVQFAGLKIFYKNDTKEDGILMTPADALQLSPKPIYIQYQ